MVLTAAVLVGAGAGLGGWYLWGREDGSRRDDARPKVSTAPTTAAPDPGGEPGGATQSAPSESGGTTQGTSASPSESSAEPPPGYRAVSEGEFDIVVPESWQQRTQSGLEGVTVYFYEEPGGGPRYLQVFRVTEPDATPLGTLRTAEKDLKQRAPDYRRNSLAGVADDRGEAAELDYSSRSEKWGLELRTLDRVIHADADAGELYVVLASGPADAWPEQREVLETAVGSFCLGGVC